MLRPLVLSALLALSPLPATAQDDLGTPPAGTYRLDLAHGRLIFKVNHLGFSTYIGLFTRFDATLQFDPDAPGTMSVTASIDAASLETHYPDPAYDFNAQLTGPDFLDAGQFPQIAFASTAVTLTGATTADVTGDLTLHGVTRPVTISVTYNGGWGHMPLDPGGARAGFSATGTLNRSDFGIAFGIPAPGTTMGVSDRVDFEIETEFSNPDAPRPAP
ncbi:YceI family protein [Rhodobacter sp. Har01]|uniref:YceI family protein n=1 Tax=Rhodobacter sp. Har01 TaxID=2883999 RepID=UPI001D08BA63|nr:YceI family protein [Rhodobacter sp. Har01]MCB6179591.1 YceI family protein [Rhodobacter sp. Har01]